MCQMFKYYGENVEAKRAISNLNVAANKTISTVYTAAEVQLTFALKAIPSVSLIAFTPVIHDIVCSGAHVRCERNAGGVRMTYTGCIGFAAPWIWANV